LGSGKGHIGKEREKKPLKGPGFTKAKVQTSLSDFKVRGKGSGKKKTGGFNQQEIAECLKIPVKRNRLRRGI